MPRNVIVLLLVLAAHLALGGCASSSAQRIGTTTYPRLPKDAPVLVFTDEAQVKQPFEVVGIISYTNPGKYQVLNLGDAIEPLKAKAREVGGEAVILGDSEAIKSGIISTGIAANARAIRFIAARGSPKSATGAPPSTQAFLPQARQAPQNPAVSAAQLREAEDRLADSVAQLAPAGNGPELIESNIDGTFEEWSGDTVFRLANGQVWQQVTYSYTYHYAFNPKVYVVKVRNAYKMIVDGVERSIFVKRFN